MAKRNNKKTNPLEKPVGADLAALGIEQAVPSTTGVRTVASAAVGSGLTPSKLTSILAGAADLSDTATYLALAEELEEKDLQYRALISTRKLAVSGLPRVIEAATDAAADTNAADAVRALMSAEWVDGMVTDLLDGLSKGFAVSALVWDTAAKIWTPHAVWKDPRWFVFAADGHTLQLAPKEDGGAPEELKYAGHIVHMPKLKSGLPIRAGLARPALAAWLIKNIASKGWAIFAEVYGQPTRVGRYPADWQNRLNDKQVRANINALKRAVSEIGTDSAAILPDNMLIEFVEAAKRGDGVAVYKELCAYVDAGLAKLVLGQTLTSGDGNGSGSYALGQVHGEVRAELVRADAKALAATIQRCIVEPYVRWNFGDTVGMPTFRLQVETPTDTAALADALAKLVPLGLEVEQSVIRDRLGLPDPTEGAQLLAPAQIASGTDGKMSAAHGVTLSAGSTGCPHCDGIELAAAKRDRLDGVVDDANSAWERLDDGPTAAIAAAYAASTGIDDLRERLLQVVNSEPAPELARLLSLTRLKGRAAGELGLAP